MIWVFDAYGTLWDITRIEAAVQRVQIPDSGSFLALWRQKQLEYAFLRTLTGDYEPFSVVTRDALQYTLESAGVRVAPKDREQLWAAWFHPHAFEDAAELLESLQGHGRWILSNGDPGMLAAGIEATGLGKCLEGVVSVDAVRRYKPHPDAYRLVIETANVSREDVIFVSSNGWDVAGATRFGFQTVWVNRSGAALDRLGIKPWRVVHRLADLRGGH